jgi:hypothetical protein
MDHADEAVRRLRSQHRNGVVTHGPTTEEVTEAQTHALLAIVDALDRLTAAVLSIREDQ